MTRSSGRLRRCFQDRRSVDAAARSPLHPAVRLRHPTHGRPGRARRSSPPSLASQVCMRSISRARRVPAIALPLAALALAAARPLGAQAAPRGRWEITGLPAINYDADEGLGYGAVVELYDYAPGARPYRLTIQPTLFLTTQGRRDLTV